MRDHIVSHIDGKDTTKCIWDALSMLYEVTSKEQKRFLEEKMRCIHVKKGEVI